MDFGSDKFIVTPITTHDFRTPYKSLYTAYRTMIVQYRKTSTDLLITHITEAMFNKVLMTIVHLRMLAKSNHGIKTFCKCFDVYLGLYIIGGIYFYVQLHRIYVGFHLRTLKISYRAPDLTREIVDYKVVKHTNRLLLKPIVEHSYRAPTRAEARSIHNALMKELLKNKQKIIQEDFIYWG